VRIGAVSGRVGHAPGGGCSVGPVAGAGVVGERRLRGVVVVAVAVSPRADETGDAAEDALALLGAVDALDGEVRGDTRGGGLVVGGDDELFGLVGAAVGASAGEPPGGKRGEDDDEDEANERSGLEGPDVGVDLVGVDAAGLEHAHGRPAVSSATCGFRFSVRITRLGS